MANEWSEHVLTGQPVVQAPTRAARPKGLTSTGCAFCPGQESRTPPTTDQEPVDGAWSARAFANLYPILESHEVIVDSRRHVARFDELTPDEAEAAVRLWARRIADLRRDQPFVMLYRNDGPLAGASVPHGHAQLVGTKHALPHLQAEANRMERGCPFEVAASWRQRHQGQGMVWGSPATARLGGEIWIVPAAHEQAFELSPRPVLAAFVHRLREACAAAVAQGVPGYNVVLHTGPTGTKRFHWHAEILPRREGIAGLELGGGVWVDTGPPS